MDINAIVQVKKNISELNDNFLVVKMLDHIGNDNGLKTSFEVFLDSINTYSQPAKGIYTTRESVNLTNKQNGKWLIHSPYNPFLTAIGNGSEIRTKLNSKMQSDFVAYTKLITNTKLPNNPPFAPLDLVFVSTVLAESNELVTRFSKLFVNQSIGAMLITHLITHYPASKIKLEGDSIKQLMIGSSKAMFNQLQRYLNHEFLDLEKVLFYGQDISTLDKVVVNLDGKITIH